MSNEQTSFCRSYVSNDAPPVAARSVSRTTVCALVVVLIGVGVFFCLNRPKTVLHSTDAVYYLAGAQSLAQGTGYRMILYADAPAIRLYPPLQSLYLSLFWRSDGKFPENLPWLHGGMILLALGCTATFFLALQRSSLPWISAALIPLCLAVQPTTYGTVFGCISELLFCVLSYGLALLWLGRAGPPGNRRWFATGVILSLMFLTRTAAIPVLIGTAGVAIAKFIKTKDWRPLVLCGLPILLACVMWGTASKGGSNYADYFHRTFSDGRLQTSYNNSVAEYALKCAWRGIDYNSVSLVECLNEGLPHLLSSLSPGSAVWRTASFALPAMLAGFCTVISVIGFWRSTSTTVRVIGLMVALYYAELIVWPYSIHARGIMPVLPFLCFGFCAGLEYLPGRIRLWAKRSVALSLVIGLIPSAYVTMTAEDPRAAADRYAELRELATWAKEKLPPSARIATQADWFVSDFPMMHFVSLSGHKLVQTKGEPLPAFINRVDYVVFERFSALKQTLEISGTGKTGEVVYRTPRNTFQIVKIVPQPHRPEASQRSDSDHPQREGTFNRLGTRSR